MAKKIFLSLIMPVFLAGMLMLWEQLTYVNFNLFWGILAFFVLAILASIVAKKKIQRNYIPFVITFFVLTLIISILISPNPYALWQNWQSVKKDHKPISLNAIGAEKKSQLLVISDAYTLPNAITTQVFNFKGNYNGSRAMVPLVSKGYQPGDSIMAYAAFSSYVGDHDNASWFILDKDEDDYKEDWLTVPVHQALIIKDTAKIADFTPMMQQLNQKHHLVAASQKVFVVVNYPEAGFRYVAKKIRQTGMVLLILLVIIQMQSIISTKPEGEAI